VRENCAVTGLRERLGAGDLARLRRIGQASGTGSGTGTGTGPG
jgi:hypothetical protein